MADIKAYITDLDGTLCDTRAANIVAYEKAFKDAGLDFDRIKYESAFGLRFGEMMDLVSPLSTETERQTVQTQKKIHYADSLDLVDINQALVALLTQLKHDGRKIGLATTAQSQNASKVLQYFSLDPLFDQILYGDDVEKGKPDPECYTKIITKLGVDASECLVFEDSDIGVQAAQAAGASVLKIVI